MSNCICLVQEGQIADEVKDQLLAGIRGIVLSNDLGEDANIAWIVIPEGQGWTAGQPSTSSVVSMTAPPIEQSHRERVLTQLCDFWTETTGCNINEIVATVMPLVEEN